VGIINGGNRVVGSSDVLTVDARPSYDPDGVVTNLFYNWTCIKGGNHYGDDCGFPMDTSTNGKLVVQPLIDTGVYIFDVLVYDTYQRSAEVSATITVSDKELTYLTFHVFLRSKLNVEWFVVQVISQSPPATEIQAIGRKVNPSKKVTIEATVSVIDGSAFNASWSLVTGVLAAGYDLPTTALTPLSMQSSPGSESFKLPLVLSPAGLMPKMTYTFQLSAQNEFDVKGASSITFATVGPPTSGSLHAHPTVGQALFDQFTLIAQDWVDDADSYPLLYSFFYIIGEDGPGVTEYLLTANQMSQKLGDTNLPPGSNQTSTITAVSYVKNVYEAEARSTVRMTVYPPNVSQSRDERLG